MKKMNKIYKAFLLVAALLLLVSCSNFSENEKPVAEEGAVSEATVKITGSINLPSLARTAYSSGSGVEEWSVKATKGRKKQVIEVESDLTFSCELTPGTWKFTAYGLKTNPANNNLEPVLSGSTSVEITSTETPSQIKIPVSIEVSSGVAKINLKIYDETDKAKSLEAVFTSVSDPDVTFTKSNDFTNGEAEIRVPEGLSLNSSYANYTAVITIYDTYDEVLFKCSEEVILFPNFTTDKWGGSSSYIDSDGSFVLTDEIVKAYNMGNFSSSLINTPVVLWNRLASDTNDDYIQGLQVFADVDSSTVVTKSILSDEVIGTYGKSFDNWCFGDNNSLYYAYVKSVSGYGGIVIDKYIPHTNGYYTEYIKTGTVVDEPYTISNSNVYVIRDITYSPVSINGTNRKLLFVLYEQDEYSGRPGMLRIYDVSSWDGTTIENATFSITDAAGWTGTNITFGHSLNKYDHFYHIAVGNNKVYITYYSANFLDSEWEQNFKIFEFSLEEEAGVMSLNYSGADSDLNYIRPFINEGFASNIGNYVTLSDFILSNQNLYMLFSITRDNEYKIGEEEVPGYSMPRDIKETVHTSSGCLLCYNLGTNTYARNTSNSVLLGGYIRDQDIWNNTEHIAETKKIFATPPLEDERKYFYGPRKIIAIKPDELVIADDGYQYDTDPAFAKEKNRVVRLKLSNWAISSVEDVGVMFDGKVSVDSCGNVSLKTSGTD